VVFIALALLLLSACGMRSGNMVVVAGSTSVLPYAEILAEAYMHLHEDEEIDIQGGGSSAGITAAESGIAAIGMSSRALKESEQWLWSIEIAKDGLAIIVHPSNPVSDMTLEDIRAIFAQDLSNWGELGGRDARIHIIAREEGSGSRSAFEDLVMGGCEISPRAIVQASNGAVRQLVSDDPNAIGFISLGLVEEGEKPVKALCMQGVTPTRENVINGSYELFRPFLFVAREEPVGPAMRFIEFILSPEGRRILTSEGLVAEDSAALPPDAAPVITEATSASAVTDPDFDCMDLFQRLEGYWNTPYGALEGVNGYGFINFRYEDGKPCLYTGVYESEGTSFGDLVGGSSIGENMAALNFWSPAAEDGLWAGRPEMTETVSLDMAGLKDGSIRIKRESPIWSIDWITYAYGGETFAEAERNAFSNAN